MLASAPTARRSTPSLISSAAGCSNQSIYREKVTGAGADRRDPLRMLDRLDPGDGVTVTRIDRLARSTFDLFGIVKQIVDAKAQFRSLAEPWADAGTSTERLMLAVLGGRADVERDLIRTLTGEGREPRQGPRAAHGRPPSLTPARQKKAPDGTRRAVRCRNWGTAIMSAYRPSAVRHGAHDRHSGYNRVLWPTPTRRPALVRQGACRVSRHGMDQA
jgi:DNA invertase Pin-like site-specific DNA recombinase